MYRKCLALSSRSWIKNCVGLILVTTLGLGIVGGAPAIAVNAENGRQTMPLVKIPEGTASLIEAIVAYQIWVSESKERDCRTVETPDLYATGFIGGSPRVKKVITVSGLSERKALAAAVKGYIIGCTKQPTRRYARLAGAGTVLLAVVDFTPSLLSSVCAAYRQDPKGAIQAVSVSVTRTVLPRAFEDGVGKGLSGGCSQI